MDVTGVAAFRRLWELIRYNIKVDNVTNGYKKGKFVPRQYVLGKP